MDKRDFIRLFLKISPAFIAGLATVISASFMMSVLFKDIKILKTKATEQEKYFQCLELGLTNNTFDEEYCKTSFNHFDRKSSGSLSKYGYIELLEDFLVYLSNKDKGFKEEHYKKTIEVLRKAKQTEPFASLPSEEKRLMDNIQIFIQKNDNQNSINTLNELKQVILSRHKEYERIEKQNSWSIPLAFIGIFFTIIFGIWTTTLAVKRSQKRSSSE